MAQFYYSILGNLIKKHNHIRGLAKDLNTNQTTIARKVKEMQGQNILDFREEGRNKVFFIKDSIESNESLLMLEHQKLIMIIEKYPRLRKIVENIKANNEIRLAIFFGSYVKGNISEKSDVDLYLETENREVKKRISQLDSKLSIKIGKFDVENLLVKEIIKDHVIIKGAERYYGLIHKKADIWGED